MQGVIQEKGWEVGGRFKREGTYVHLWLTYVDVWWKPTQYCSAIILQLKINYTKNTSIENVPTSTKYSIGRNSQNVQQQMDG